MAFICTAAELVAAADAGTAVASAATMADGAAFGSQVASSLADYSLGDLANINPESMMSDGFSNTANSVLDNTIDGGPPTDSIKITPDETSLRQEQLTSESAPQPTPQPTPQTNPYQSQFEQSMKQYGNSGTDTSIANQAANQTTQQIGQGINAINPQGTLVQPNGTLPGQPSAWDSLSKGFDSVTKWMKDHPYLTSAGAYGLANALGLTKTQNVSLPAGQGITSAPIQPMGNFSSSTSYTPNTNVYKSHYADGGIAQGGPVAQMSQQNIMGDNQNYPGAQNYSSAFANPNTTPIPQNVVTGPQDVNTDPYTGDMKMASGGIVAFAGGGAPSYSPQIYTDIDPNTKDLDPLSASLYRNNKLGNAYGVTTGIPLPTANPLGKMSYQPINVQEQAAAQQAQQAAQPQQAQQIQSAASGGIMGINKYNLGGYAEGGNPRLLKGPGDGMSDNIPAVIGDKQPARLADGEFVVPADVVSGLGNGSTDAGAKKLHHMMDKVRVARTGTKQQGKQINPNKFMPS